MAINLKALRKQYPTVADLGDGPGDQGPPFIFSRKKEIAEGRKAGRASNPLSPCNNNVYLVFPIADICH